MGGAHQPRAGSWACRPRTPSPTGPTDCSDCGTCEEKCPQNVPVRKTFEQVREDLEGPLVKTIAGVGRRVLKTSPDCRRATPDEAGRAHRNAARHEHLGHPRTSHAGQLQPRHRGGGRGPVPAQRAHGELPRPLRGRLRPAARPPARRLRTRRTPSFAAAPGGRSLRGDRGRPTASSSSIRTGGANRRPSSRAGWTESSARAWPTVPGGRRRRGRPARPAQARTAIVFNTSNTARAANRPRSATPWRRSGGTACSASAASKTCRSTPPAAILRHGSVGSGRPSIERSLATKSVTLPSYGWAISLPSV